jgi:hypothetical protein
MLKSGEESGRSLPRSSVHGTSRYVLSYFFFNSMGLSWHVALISHSVPQLLLSHALVTVSSTVQSLLLQIKTSPSLTFIRPPPLIQNAESLSKKRTMDVEESFSQTIGDDENASILTDI